ncbi:hypothetical protein FK216_07250 [Moraxellaceae bacterium AER2_44_116]|nr:hypothetical protein [Moraxellaceae bacterium]TQC98083.1 hypothetical protein FK216_07250 [Moraxellaceae bacterium AER2_44_116]
MRKIIKSMDDMPRNFDISKYRNMDKISAFDWHILLARRHTLLFYIEAGINECNRYTLEKKPDLDKQEEYLLELLNLTLENPLNCSDEPYIGISEKYGIASDGRASLGYFLNKKAIYQIEGWDLMFFYDSWRRYGNYTTAEDGRLQIPIDDLHKTAIDNFSKEGKSLLRGMYPILVNPYYPNNEIFDALGEELRLIRKKFKIGKTTRQITYQDLLKWSSYKVLAYFDLKLWELLHGTKTTKTVICRALYDKGEYGEDNLRKSVEPLLHQLMYADCIDSSDESEWSIHDALAALAREEIGKNPAKYFPE